MSAELLPEHLLEQARHLARREHKRPRQASLRRAVSTAYYALFHLLVRDSVKQMGPGLNEELRNRVYRWFDHGAMYQVAKAFRQDVETIHNSKVILFPKNNLLVRMTAQHFVDLQELRHSADYDPGAVFVRTDVLESIDNLVSIFKVWPSVRDTPQGNALLLSFLLWDKWGKRL